MSLTRWKSVLTIAWAASSSVLAQPAPSPDRPVHWSLEAGGTGSWYQVIVLEQPVDFGAARRIAKELGGDLASLNTPEENAFVYGLIPDAAWKVDSYGNNTGPWIGAVHPSYETTSKTEGWMWLDGQKVTWAAWAPGQPNNWQQRYSQFWTHGRGRNPTWQDVQGDSLYPSLVVEWATDPSWNHAEWTPRGAVIQLDLGGQAHFDMRAHMPAFQALALDSRGVRFGIRTDRRAWVGGGPTGDAIFELPNADVRVVHLLASTRWGLAGHGMAWVEVIDSKDRLWRAPLHCGTHTRNDYMLKAHPNTLDPRFASTAWLSNDGQRTLDHITVPVPVELAQSGVRTIRIVDRGADRVQRLLVVAAAAELAPQDSDITVSHTIPATPQPWVLTDSIDGFADGGSWSYGSTRPDRDAFTEMQRGADGAWHARPGVYATSIDATTATPNTPGSRGGGTLPTLQWPVRRWSSDRATPALLAVSVGASPHAQGLETELRLAGRTLWRAPVPARGTIGTLLRADLGVGDHVELIVRATPESRSVAVPARLTVLEDRDRPPPAHEPDDRPVLVVPLTGQIGLDVTGEGLADALDAASGLGVERVALVFDCSGHDAGPAAEVLAILMEHAQRFRYEAIVRRALGTAVLPLAAAHAVRVVDPGDGSAIIGAVPDGSIADVPPSMAAAFGLAAEEGPWDPLPLYACLDPGMALFARIDDQGLTLHAARPEGGVVLQLIDRWAPMGVTASATIALGLGQPVSMPDTEHETVARSLGTTSAGDAGERAMARAAARARGRLASLELDAMRDARQAARDEAGRARAAAYLAECVREIRAAIAEAEGYDPRRARWFAEARKPLTGDDLRKWGNMCDACAASWLRVAALTSRARSAASLVERYGGTPQPGIDLRALEDRCEREIRWLRTNRRYSSPDGLIPR